jgi:hypothetical protein
MMQREAGIDDVLDHKHILARDLAPNVLQNPHLAAGMHLIAVRRSFKKIYLHRQINLSHKIGDEDKGAA